MELSDHLNVCVARALETGEPVDVRVYLSQSPEDEFLAVFAAFTTTFGIPDFPGGATNLDWRGELKLDNRLLGVWDFDYYVLSLSVTENSILVQKYIHGT